jgi:hypothetical protein
MFMFGFWFTLHVLSISSTCAFGSYHDGDDEDDEYDDDGDDNSCALDPTLNMA